MSSGANKPSGLWAATLLVLRIVTGGLFVVAGWIKVTDPQSFAESISGFQIVPEGAEHLTVLAAFALPWAELICGVLIILGLATRAASLLATLMLLVFIGAIVSVLGRGMELSCGCFGKLDFICSSPIGTCHLVRNGVHAVLLLVLVFAGGGRIAFDALMGVGREGARGDGGSDRGGPERGGESVGSAGPGRYVPDRGPVSMDD